MNLEGVSPRVGHAYAVHADYAHKRNMRMRMKMSSTLATSIDSHSRHHKTAWVPLQVWAELAARDHLLPGDRRRNRSSHIQLAERGQSGHLLLPPNSDHWSPCASPKMEPAKDGDGAQSGLFQEILSLPQRLPGETSQQLEQFFSSKTLLSFLHFVSVLKELDSSSSLGKTKLPSPLYPRRRRRTKTCQPASVKSPDTRTPVMNLQSPILLKIWI